MSAKPPSRLDHLLARVCRGCPVCRQARSKPGGLANRWVRKIEGRFCPFCRAYRRVYGRRSSDPQAGPPALPSSNASSNQ